MNEERRDICDRETVRDAEALTDVHFGVWLADPADLEMSLASDAADCLSGLSFC